MYPPSRKQDLPVVSLLFAFPSPPAPVSLIKIINENIRDDRGRVSVNVRKRELPVKGEKKCEFTSKNTAYNEGLQITTNSNR